MKHISQDPNISKKELKHLIIFISIFGILLFIFIMYFVIFYKIGDFLAIMGLAFFGTIPAFLSDAFMPIAASIPIKKYPMDGGRIYKGKRILGPGKTWNGFIGGIILGFITSYILSLLYPWLYDITVKNMADGTDLLVYIKTEDILFFVDTRTDPLKFHLRTILLCIGGPIGDAIGSFIKRRLNRPRGSQVFILDQIDFLIVAILMAYPVFPLKWVYIVFLILFTPLLTVFANIIGYYIGAKEVPW
ncbi:MAG: CDP-archaeol synthase [Promethearchaeota archaeon]